MNTEREIIEIIRDEVVLKFDSVFVSGPFTTLYWDANKKDNVPQQQLTVQIGDQEFQILVREKK